MFLELWWMCVYSHRLTWHVAPLNRDVNHRLSSSSSVYSSRAITDAVEWLIRHPLTPEQHRYIVGWWWIKGKEKVAFLLLPSICSSSSSSSGWQSVQINVANSIFEGFSSAAVLLKSENDDLVPPLCEQVAGKWDTELNTISGVLPENSVGIVQPCLFAIGLRFHSFIHCQAKVAMWVDSLPDFESIAYLCTKSFNPHLTWKKHLDSGLNGLYWKYRNIENYSFDAEC